MGDLWIHHQHQVLQVAQGGLQRVQEASEEVHPYHRLYQGVQGTLCPCRLASSRALRSAMTRSRPLCRTPPRSSVPWSPRGPASMCPSWFPSWRPLRSALMSPRRSAPGLGPTPGLSRSLLSRSGATFLLRNLALPKFKSYLKSFKIKKATSEVTFLLLTL